MLILIVSILSTLFVFLTALSFGFLAGSTFNMGKIEFIAYYFIQSMSYGMLALLLSVLIKRSGLSIGLFFLYSFIIENFVGAILNNMGGIKSASGPGDYLPLNTTDNLIPFPFFRSLVRFGEPPSLYVLLGLSAVYLFLYYFISVRRFQTQDL